MCVLRYSQPSPLVNLICSASGSSACIYTKGNIAVVGNFLRQSGLLLEHPILIPSHVLYHNPGVHARAPMTCSRTDYSGPGGSSSRWSTPTAPGKLLIQCARVDELFKILQGGELEELEETEPHVPISRIAYCSFDCVSTIQFLKSEPSHIHIRRKR